ncbi:MAG: Hsp20/alpha crystallin family protein [Bacteroidales bacterium]|jgi:HSP20 family protein
MSLIKRNEFIPTLPMTINDFFNRDWLDWANNNYSLTGINLPLANIKESKDEFTVELAAPGMSKEDFKIELNDDILTISSEKKFEKKENDKYAKCEFSYQSFSRSFSLPDAVKEEDIQAKYENGILKIVIPKDEKAKLESHKLIKIA